MTARASILTCVLALAVGLVWILVPPFPPPRALLYSSLPSLTQRFGAPLDASAELPAELRPARAAAWKKYRGIAVWTLEAGWTRAPADATAHPDIVARCLRLRWLPEWASVVLFLPCDSVVMAQVMASNHRWRVP